MSVELLLLISLAALFGNAFFVGAEFAFVSARRSSIELAAAEGSRAARICLAAMDNVTLTIATIQFGVTLCSLIFGAISEPVVAHLLEPLLAMANLPYELLHPISFVIALVLMVSLHVVIGEMVPKNLSLADPTNAALKLVPPLYAFVKVVKPIVLVLNGAARITLRGLGMQPHHEINSSFSRDEVAGFVQESRREGLISKDEEHRLTGSLDFEYRTIEAIIVPMRKLVTAEHDATAYDIEQLSLTTNFSRFPVMARANGFKGYVHVKDVLPLAPMDKAKPLGARTVRPLSTVERSATLMQALTEMRRIESHMLQVQYGGKTIGVIMLEDVLEELVGPISQVR